MEQIRSEFSCDNQNPAAEHSNVIWAAGLCTTILPDVGGTVVGAATYLEEIITIIVLLSIIKTSVYNYFYHIPKCISILFL